MALSLHISSKHFIEIGLRWFTTPCNSFSNQRKLFDLDKKHMMHQKYESNRLKYAILDLKNYDLKKKSKYEQKPQVDSNSWSAIYNPYTLTTELYK